MRETQKPAGLGRSDRPSNAASAFLCHWGQERPFGSASLWLVDDVATTGATLDAAALALGRAGLDIAGALTVAIADRELDATPKKPG